MEQILYDACLGVLGVFSASPDTPNDDYLLDFFGTADRDRIGEAILLAKQLPDEDVILPDRRLMAYLLLGFESENQMTLLSTIDPIVATMFIMKSHFGIDELPPALRSDETGYLVAGESAGKTDMAGRWLAETYAIWEHRSFCVHLENMKELKKKVRDPNKPQKRKQRRSWNHTSPKHTKLVAKRRI